MFAFIVTPLHPGKKSFFVHAHFAETGVFNDITLNLIGHLLNALIDSKFDIIYPLSMVGSREIGGGGQ